MATRDQTMPTFDKGKPLETRSLRALARLVVSVIRVGRGLTMTRAGNRITIGLANQTGQPRPTRFQITALANDYLTCVRVHDDAGTVGTNTYSVAKPPILWHDTTNLSNVDSVAELGTPDTNAITVTKSGETDEDWYVSPSVYAVGDTIYASQPVGGTGVTDGGGESVVWMDENRDGRSWAAAI